MALSDSPLFRNASKMLQQELQREFQRTSIGRLITEAKTAYSTGAQFPENLMGAIGKYAPSETRNVLSALKGVGFGSFAREVEKYAKGETWRWISSWLGGMGEAGQLIKALVTPGTLLKDELQILHQVLGQFDMPDPLKGLSPNEVTAWAVQHLRGQGYGVVEPGRKMFHPEGGEAVRKEKLVWPDQFAPSKTLAGLPPDHPINTGDMVPTPNSTNVHSIGYHMDEQSLFVRFKAHHAGQKKTEKSNEPGSLYRYQQVAPAEFLDLLNRKDHPGIWVWDHLRVRGSWSLHTRPYELVGIVAGYVPRKAWSAGFDEQGRLKEYFVPRVVGTEGGGTAMSTLPFEEAPSLGFGRMYSNGSNESAFGENPLGFN
jgi:hypothetical protein